MLTHAVNLLQNMITMAVSALGGNPGRVKPIPLPRSRFDELVELKEKAAVDDLADRFGLS